MAGEIARYRVIGAMPIRDVVTKESIPAGQIVQLEARDSDLTKGSTLIDALIDAGCIEPAREPVKPTKAANVMQTGV